MSQSRGDPDYWLKILTGIPVIAFQGRAGPDEQYKDPNVFESMPYVVNLKYCNTCKFSLHLGYQEKSEIILNSEIECPYREQGFS